MEGTIAPLAAYGWEVERRPQEGGSDRRLPVPGPAHRRDNGARPKSLNSLNKEAG